MWFQNFRPKILKPHYQFFAPLLLHIYSLPDSTFIVCTVEHRNHIGEMAMVGAKSVFRLVSDTLYRLCVVDVNVNALVKTIDHIGTRLLHRVGGEEKRGGGPRVLFPRWD